MLLMWPTVWLLRTLYGDPISLLSYHHCILSPASLFDISDFTLIIGNLHHNSHYLPKQGFIFDGLNGLDLFLARERHPLSLSQGFPVIHYLPEFAQTYIHWVSNNIHESLLSWNQEYAPKRGVSIEVLWNLKIKGSDKCLDLVHWEDPEGSGREGGGRGDRDGEHM